MDRLTAPTGQRQADGSASCPLRLTLTGERTLPGIGHENYWFRRHEAAYLALAPLLRGTVVEAGAGEGYGTELLRAHGARVLALELDPAAATHARARYAVPVARADLQAMPLLSGSVDAVASLQTIEHLHDQEAFVGECARVLRPRGVLAITTPNSRTFPKGNPFHTRELELAELVALLGPSFTVTHRWGVQARGHLEGIEAEQLAVPQEQWGEELRARVEAVTAADFTVGPAAHDDLDLVVAAERR